MKTGEFSNAIFGENYSAADNGLMASASMAAMAASSLPLGTWHLPRLCLTMARSLAGRARAAWRGLWSNDDRRRLWPYAAISSPILSSRPSSPLSGIDSWIRHSSQPHLGDRQGEIDAGHEAKAHQCDWRRDGHQPLVARDAAPYRQHGIDERERLSEHKRVMACFDDHARRSFFARCASDSSWSRSSLVSINGCLGRPVRS